MLPGVKKVHFVGIGGIGMSGLAAILLERGFIVSGSDLKPGRLIDAIGRKNGRVYLGHRSSNIPDGTGLVVFSSSIDENNPEIIKARQDKIPIVHRSDIAAAIVNPAKGIAVTGAHGKTTTTAMAARLLIDAGLDPTVILGGETDFLGGNWRSGKGGFAVYEADESDGTFLKITPQYAVITNIDREHMDYYKDLDAVIEANRSFIGNIKSGGCLITCTDDPNIRRILKNCGKRFVTYARDPSRAAGADIYPDKIRMDRMRSYFEAVYKGGNLGGFELNIPGAHNIENSLAVILLGIELGLDMGTIRKALASYNGTKRRFQVKGVVGDIMVVEDYAHHPREIAATIAACRNWQGRRAVAVFQPHRYTRTKLLKDDFGKSFLGLDELVLTDIYAASEDPIEGVSVKTIYDAAVKNGQKNISIIKKEKILPYLIRTLMPGDTVLILGAGDIGELSDELVKGLKNKRKGVTEGAPV